MNTKTLSRLTLLAAAAALCLAAIPATAQTVYRCGNTYGTAPCENGKEVNTNDVRSAEEKARADAATRNDIQMADTLERKRLRDEAAVLAERTKRAKAQEKEKKKQEKLAKAEALKQARLRKKEEARLKPKKGHSEAPEFVTLVPKP